MKNSKTCPKCGSNDIISNFDGKVVNGEGLHVSFLGAIAFDLYICGDCGYVEHWVNDADLEKVKKAFGSIKTE